ncbi:UbiA prenyltransferase family [Cryptosporidium meleagridis]
MPALCSFIYSPFNLPSKTTNFFSEQECRKQFIISKYSGVILLLGIIFSKYKASKKHSYKDSNTLHKG